LDAQNTAFPANKTLNIGGHLMVLNEPIVMGILNVTPDSFYDGGFYQSERDIVTQAERMLTEGATIIDVGGYSSRPGAEDVPESQERNRVTKAINAIRSRFPQAIISVDTFRSVVAIAACDAGASMINDISGGELDPLMLDTVARLNVPYILMHMRGTPQTMKNLASYDDVVASVRSYFHEKIFNLHQRGIKDIIIDPGFGFAKTREQNFELLKRLPELQIFQKPVLAGVSRKSMVWKTLDQRPEDALNGTSVLNTVALMKGASILRVHDVKACVEAVKLTRQLR
jgi:dihydropteroate synthase